MLDLWQRLRDYLKREACEDLDRWEELMQDIIAVAGSDRAVHNPERLMRLPGFRNWKYEPAREAHIIDIERHAVFAFEHLRQLAPRKQEQERQQREQQAITHKRVTHRDAGDSVIHAFNKTHDINAILATYGYSKGPKGRYIRPGGKSESVSVRGGRSCHHSSSDRMHEYKPPGCACGVADPFDLYRAHEHGGDFSRAVKAAAEAMGMKARSGRRQTNTKVITDQILVAHMREMGAA